MSTSDVRVSIEWWFSRAIALLNKPNMAISRKQLNVKVVKNEI